MPRLRNTVIALALSVPLLTTSATQGHSQNGSTTTVSITSVSGYAGHAFVYAQVSDSTFAFPAPTGTGHQSPYVSEWIAQPFPSSSCPWIWAVYVFNRATMVQINVPPASWPLPNFGTTTIVCAGPTVSPVDQPAQADAAARLDLDLQVAVSPPDPTAGSTSVISAVLSSALTQDLNLYLSMAIEDWSVSSWTVDFGDGQNRTLNGPVGTAIQLNHVYQSAGRYEPRAVAFIAGHAQAAVYDRYGTVHLVRRPFSVVVGNSATATARRPPARAYLPPQVEVAVVPFLGPVVSDGSPTPFRQIDVLRGAMTTLVVHLVVGREGLLLVDGVPQGFGHSRLTGWRYDGPRSDAPPGSATIPGKTYPAGEPMRMQWDSPDRIVAGQPEDYPVPVTLYIDTIFSDGHRASYLVPSSFSVSVDFAAQSG
jgi:hypothetical protein